MGELFADPLPMTTAAPSGEPGYLFETPLPVILIGGASGASTPGATGATGASGAGGSGSSGGLLARLQYAPTETASYSILSTSPAAVDATNLTLAFTAPTTGDVLVRLVAAINTVTGGCNFCVLDHTGHAQYGFSVFAGPGTGATESAVCDFLITGLTSGDVYQIDFGWCSPTFANMAVTGQTGVPSPNYASPALMEIWSA